jgi:hypothetical protein
MIRHIVVWRWKTGVDLSAAESALTQVVALEAQADGALASSWTRNNYFRDRGFTHAVIGDFIDEAAVVRWVESDRHAESAHLVRDIGDAFCVFDIEEPYRHPVLIPSEPTLP